MKRLVMTAILLAAGCATSPTVNLYSGPDRPRRELATVVVPYQVELEDINGTRIPFRSGLRATSEYNYKLLPGRYTFGFRFTSPYEFGADRQGVSTPRQERAANLAAGRSYRIKTKVKGTDAGSAEVLVWVEDESTGKPVDEVVPDPVPVAAAAPRPAAPEPIAPAPVPKPVAVEPEPVAATAPAEVAAPVQLDTPVEAPTPVPAAAPAPFPQPAPQPVPQAAPAPTSSAVDDLNRIWQSATPEERAEFLKSIVAP
ncbi:MAG TPA: hypothetical protein VIH35_04170 [Kiritimatiellia bacterium]|jgi:hypothetical protein